MENLEKRLRVIEFEFDHLRDRLVNGQLERWIPGIADKATHLSHINRYEWVSSFIEGATVLDLACGSGHGSALLAGIGKAQRVLGGDINTEAISYCLAKHYDLPNLSFQNLDCESFSKGLEESIEALVSFETVEHLRNPDEFFKEARKVLSPGASLFISTPISKKRIDHNPSNRYHRIEWSCNEFIRLVQSHGFRVEIVMVQPFRTKLRKGLLGLFGRVIRKIRFSIAFRGRFADWQDHSIIPCKSRAEIDWWQYLVSSGNVKAFLLIRASKDEGMSFE